MTNDPNTPAGEPGPDAKPTTDKVDKLANDALEAGRKLTESETGQKVVGAAEAAFETGEDLARKALDSNIGRKVTETAGELHRKALETETGRKVADAAEGMGQQAMDSDVGQTAKKMWNTSLGRNVGTGAAAGAALGIVIPFVGPIIGAIAGGSLGYLRSLAKKR